MAFFSSPFSSQVGQRVERATSDQLEAEDWALNMEICDMINETDEGPKDAIKALKKRIFHNKNYRQVMLALSVLETCVKNCGKRFHMHMAHKEFISEFGKLAGPKSNVPMIVKQKILALIQSWSDSFRHQPELANIGMTHEYLRRQGVEFPPQDLDTMAPIYTPERTIPESQAPSASPASRPQEEPVQLRHHHHHQTLPQQSREHPPAPSNEFTGAASITPTSEQLAKIRSEMDVVRGNVRVLSEMLTALAPGHEETSDWELLRDLNVTCRTMQSRLVDLLSRIVSEELTGELLVCNDELNHVFTRYDRFEKNRAAVVQSQSGQTANQAFETPSESASVSAPSLAPGPATGALIDFSAEEPQTRTAPSSSDAPPPSYNELHAELGQDLAGLNLGGGTSTGAPPPPSSTNPFANSSAPVASGNDYSEERGDDFDMFAQSRQSFDTAAQNIGSRTRGYTVEDSHASVAGAMNARSTFPSTEPSGVESMEQWLAATDLQSSKLPENPSDAQDTMTTSEFDKFLEERAIKVTSGGSGLNQSAQARRARPQMQKEESGHEDDLFAL